MKEQQQSPKRAERSRAQNVFETATNTYTLDKQIGEGGSGSVLRVKDIEGSFFALKLLTKADSTKRKRFKNELAFCRRNRHERIVTALDEGVDLSGSQPRPFYVMHLYDSTLRKLITQKKLVHQNVLRLFTDILDGVEAAHLMKVIHRDLKPENLLVEMPDARIAVADFGVAHFEEDQIVTSVQTAPGDRLANFAYAAPEQKTRDGVVDHRADIFALGLILNEMFTGHVPLGAAYKTITQVAPEFCYLDAVVDKMIRQSPGERHDSIRQVKEDIEAER